MKSKDFEIQILIKNKPIKQYDHEAKTFVEGRAGSAFDLKLLNNTSKKVLMVPSVDGISVIDGEPAGSESKGYIVSPYGSVTIPGWTLDNDQVAKFIFADKKDSYVANHPDKPATSNVGIIGCLVWSQKEYKYSINFNKTETDIGDSPWSKSPWKYKSIIPNTITRPSSNDVSPVYETSILRSSFDSSASLIGSQATVDRRVLINTDQGKEDAEYALGTGFGKQTEFKTSNVSFDRESIISVLEIYYDNKKNLEKRGIVFKAKKQYQEPQAFPGLIGCKPPKKWYKAY